MRLLVPFIEWCLVTGFFSAIIWLIALKNKISIQKKGVNVELQKDWVNVLALLACIGVGVLIPNVYEFPYSSKRLVRFDGDKMVYCPFGTWEWNHYCNLPAQPREVRESFLILVSSNRVKKISYSASVDIGSPEKYFAKPEHRHKQGEPWEPTDNTTVCVRKDVDSVISFWCHEFNESHAKELGNLLSNPEDPSEQDRFRNVAEPWFKSKFDPEGLVIANLRFELE